jgi:nucleotide-binding universal stress UspA family protein
LTCTNVHPYDRADGAYVDRRQQQRSFPPRHRNPAELASSFDAELTILHVTPANEYRSTRLGPILPINRQLDDPLINDALLSARQIAWTHGVSPKTVLIAGEAARAIVAVAADLDADLVVIGSRRRLAPAALTARTRTWVHAHAHCPVLVVAADRPTARRDASEPPFAT